MLLQIVTIVAVLVVYPASFFVEEETRNTIINVVIVLWLVAALVPLAQWLIARFRPRR